MKSLSAFIIFGCFVATAHVVPKVQNQNDILADTNRNTTFESSAHPLGIPLLVRRATRAACSPPTYGATHYKRDADSVKRRMTLPPPGGNAEFIVSETEDEDTIQIIWEVADGKDKNGKKQYSEPNTADYRPFRDKEFSIGTGYLKGCTVLTIVSRRAVYMAHYWESISFDLEAEDLKLWGMTEDQVFEATIVKGLTEGISKGQWMEQVSLKNHADRIDDTHVKAYLMIPDTSRHGTVDPYRTQWNRIKDTVEQFLPRLKDNNRARWTEILYTPVTTQEEEAGVLGLTSRGRCLFKYDPNHNPDANGNGQQKAMFWTEDAAIAAHDDHWT